MKKKNTQKRMINTYTALLLAVIVFLFPQILSASDANIINDVRVSSQTGGNSAETVSEGSASIRVDIEQTINGIDLPPINIEKIATGGESVEIKVEKKEAGEDFEVETAVDAQININDEDLISILAKSLSDLLSALSQALNSYIAMLF